MALGRPHYESMDRLRQRIKFGKWHRLLQDGPSFFGGRHFTQLLHRSFEVDMTRFIRPISLPRGRCLDRSDEASEGEVKALRAVAGSLSRIARQCRPDEAGTASTLQGSVSRAVVKDLSDTNGAVKRLKQTEVGLLIHAIPLVNLRTVSISDAALYLDRPDSSTQGGFIVGFTTSELHQQGSASMSPISWFIAQSETKCVGVSGWRGLHDERRVGRMRMDQRCVGVGGLSRLRTLITLTEINIIARRAHRDRHEGGQPSAD